MSSILKHELSLGDIMQNLEKEENLQKFNLFGIIVDISQPKRRQEGESFKTVLRIIDSSFNYRLKTPDRRVKHQKFVQINIYTESYQSAPIEAQIGDIVRLIRFSCQLSDSGQIICNENNFSYWKVFSRHARRDQYGGFPIVKQKSIELKPQLSYDQIEIDRVENLKYISKNFLQYNSLSYITWWTHFENKQQKGVDLILKLLSHSDHQYKFVDEFRNHFILKQNLFYFEPKLDSIYFFKQFNVEVISSADKQFQIIPGDNSFASEIDSNYYDYWKLINGNKVPEKQVEQLIEKYEFLRQYHLQGIVYQNDKLLFQGWNKMASVIRELAFDFPLLNLAQLEHKLNEGQLNSGDFFWMKVKVQKICQTKSVLMFQILDTKQETISKFTKENLHRIIEGQSRLHKVIYHFGMLVVDGTTEDPVTVYLSSIKGDNFLFKALEIIPEQNEFQKWLNIYEDMPKFEKRLQRLVDEDWHLHICVEVQKIPEKGFYLQLCNTVFLPY